jgi:D-beta-D-heptose 7-phosphate kinase/D-beta-D-heptose 1-phosphate adenosyltransferase
MRDGGAAKPIGNFMGLIVTRDELAKKIGALKSTNQKIVTTNGCFDILHVGHVRILNEAKALGDILVVGINSDESVRRLKGDSRPIVPENDRAEILANLQAVDLVTIFDEDTPVEFLQVAKPDIHVKGQDYTSKALAETPVVEAMGGSVKLLPLVESKSTTALIGKIRAL